VLTQQDWSRFETVLAPKLAGSWNLDRLTRGLDLDFLVLFSSGAGLLGASGQANHAAANAFVSAFAHRLRRDGRPAIAIDWGAWAEVGAAADHGLEQRGTRTFTPAQGLAALDVAIREAMAGGSEGTAQLAVLAVDWDAVLRSPGAGRLSPMLREMQRSGPPAHGARSTAESAGPVLLERLAAAPPNRRATVLRDAVSAMAAQVLGVADARRVDPHQPLQELGLDSLMAVELRNRLAVASGQSLPATLLFEFPTVAALTGFLGEHLLDPEPESRAPTGDSGEAGESAEEAVGLSEDEIAQLLMKKLEHLEAGTNS